MLHFLFLFFLSFRRRRSWDPYFLLSSEEEEEIESLFRFLDSLSLLISIFSLHSSFSFFSLSRFFFNSDKSSLVLSSFNPLTAEGSPLGGWVGLLKPPPLPEGPSPNPLFIVNRWWRSKVKRKTTFERKRKKEIRIKKLKLLKKLKKLKLLKERLKKIVHKKLIDPPILEAPARCILKIPRSTPIHWFSTKLLIISRDKLGGKSQKDRLFKRGKAISLYRKRRGRNQLFPKPHKKGMIIKKNNKNLWNSININIDSLRYKVGFQPNIFFRFMQIFKL